MASRMIVLLLSLSLVAISAMADDPYGYGAYEAAPESHKAASPKTEVAVDAAVKNSHEAGYYHHQQPKIDTTVIQGYVYCQGCHGYWEKHLVGAEVAAECKNEKGDVVAKGSDKTDEHGFYQIKLPYDFKSKYGVDKCKAKLVKSTDESCNTITNVGNGKEGAGVTYLKSYINEAFFKTAPFAFAKVCHAPEASTSYGGNY